MTQFAIIVPAIGDQQVVDDTLVSVLENCDGRARVLVPCDADYEDRYDLSDEVDFHRCDLARELGNAWKQRPFLAWTSLANEALYATQDPYVALMLPGVSMLPGSMDTVVEIFDSKPETASLSPVLLPADQDDTDATVAVAIPTGTRVAVSQSQLDQFGLHMIGASMMSGFFRTSALLAVGGWNTAIHPLVADVDLNMRLTEAGYEIHQTPFSRMIINSVPDLDFDRYRLARDSQIIYRQNQRSRGYSAALRPTRVIREMLSNIGSGSIATMAGRIAGAYGSLPSPARTSRQDHSTLRRAA